MWAEGVWNWSGRKDGFHCREGLGTILYIMASCGVCLGVGGRQWILGCCSGLRF